MRYLRVTALFVMLASPASADPTTTSPPGWRQVVIAATGSYFLRYIPQSLDQTAPAPVVLFLHGAGGMPELYENFVQQSAEDARVVLVLPKSSTDNGWGVGNDDQIISESLRLTRAEVRVDDHRVAIAGHSAGGAFAYLLAYGTLGRYSAVFTLSAPDYPVASVADPVYRAPILMYYGTTDPNYTGGDEAALRAQWDRLGITWREDIEAGFGHNTWPVKTMHDGFLFLAGKTYSDAPPPTCLPTATSVCLGGRFQVEVTWKDFNGITGNGSAAGCSDPAIGGSGLFWFFSPDNWEVMVKAIDGCAVNQHWWIFAAATSNVEYELTVTDTRTGAMARYGNLLGRSAPAITDTSAFACP